MDFITASIAGGLIYDILKMGVSQYLTCVKVALKDYKLNEDECILIAEDLSKTTEEDRASKESLENYFLNKAVNTKEIIEKYNKNISIIHTGSGDNITHTGSGSIILNKGKEEKK
jgi:hypothetical protein